MQNDNLERREGKGITLFVDKNSNYGLTYFKPIEDKDDPRYKRALRYEKILEEDPNYTHHCIVPYLDKDYYLTREQTENLYHYCYKCQAAKVNNWERYCQMCPYYPYNGSKNNAE